MDTFPSYLEFNREIPFWVQEQYKRALRSGHVIAELIHDGKSRETVWFMGYKVGSIVAEPGAEVAISIFREHVFGRDGSIPHNVAAASVKADKGRKAIFELPLLTRVQAAD